MRFQMMAPTSPIRITGGVTALISIKPLPTVFATDVPKTRKAIKLKKAAQATACLGVNTRVETIVAMEFAASWIPFVKSKTRAIKMIKTIKTRWGSDILDNYSFEDICHIFATINCLFKRFVYVFPLDYLNWVIR